MPLDCVPKQNEQLSNQKEVEPLLLKSLEYMGNVVGQQQSKVYERWECNYL